MKTTSFLFAFVLCHTALHAEALNAKDAMGAKPLLPGLVVTEYPRHDSQANEKDSFLVPLDQLGKPVGAAYLTKSLSPWK